MIGVLRGINKTAIQVKYFSVNNFCQFNTQATARRGSDGSTNRPPGSGQGATAHSGHLNPYITAARRLAHSQRSKENVERPRSLFTLVELCTVLRYEA